MTNQNKAAQAANENPLSDEYVNAIIQRHGYDSPETVIARLAQWIGLNGGENGVTLLMYEAHKALCKLRAPVADERVSTAQLSADERAVNTPIKTAYVEHFGHAAGWLGYKGSWFTEGFHAGRRAALASAPVAGEAQKLDAPAQVGGTRFGKGIHWSTVIHAAQRHHEYMQDPAREAARIAQAKQFQALVAGDAVPQASAEPPKLPSGWQLALNLAIDAIENAPPMDWPVNWPLIRHGLVELRDALNQPQAPQDARPCSCPSGDGSLRHPCAVHPQKDNQ